MEHWSIVRGVVVEGYKVASGAGALSPVRGGTIAAQVPFFKERGLDLSDYYPATLNVDISPSRTVLTNPRYTFRSVRWLPDRPPEDFSFSPAWLIFRGREHDALVYYPHPDTKLAHPHPPSTIELIAKFVEGIAYGLTVELRINSQEIQTL